MCDKLVIAIKKLKEINDENYGIFPYALNKTGARFLLLISRYYTIKKYDEITTEYENFYMSKNSLKGLRSYDELLIIDKKICFIIDIDINLNEMYKQLDEKEFIDACYCYIDCVIECAKDIYKIELKKEDFLLFLCPSKHKNSAHAVCKKLVFNNKNELKVKFFVNSI